VRTYVVSVIIDGCGEFCVAWQLLLEIYMFHEQKLPFKAISLMKSAITLSGIMALAIL